MTVSVQAACVQQVGFKIQTLGNINQEMSTHAHTDSQWMDSDGQGLLTVKRIIN